MNIYIENKSPYFINKIYKILKTNTQRSVNKATIINKNKKFTSFPYRYFYSKKVYEIEYIQYGLKGLKLALKYLNKKKNPIVLTIFVNDKISENKKKILMRTNSIIKIIDNSNCKENIDFYNQSKYILYKTCEEDKILDNDVLLLSFGFDPEYQCKCSSCLGKNIYISENGDISYCPEHINESIISNINIKEDYFNNNKIIEMVNSAVEKRNKCKNECEHYNNCYGYCPLENDCTNIKNKFILKKEYIANISKIDLAKENYATIKAVLKDAVYTEN